MTEIRADFVWSRPARGARGPKPTHTRDEFAQVSVQIADSEGIDAVSIRRVAQEVGVAPAALYRYVRRKDELHDLMVDLVFAEQAPPELSGHWRTDLRVVAYEARHRALRHPWLTTLSTQRIALGPGSLAWMEFAFGAFDGHELTADEIMTNVQTLIAFVTGHVLGQIGEEQASARSGMNHDEWLQAMSVHGEEIIGSGRYPRVARLMVEAAGPHDPDHADHSFDLGVERILDGMSAMVGAR
ncbi:TetR/AcrR family transcriptional regulator [Labedaea rhizosphaerae]|uniref:TetR family transcriptional regulator n=1 Tax=Labedaea rhizosphaerae TaxID=598644 RepID=A0A4V3CXQ2_LABRH|nr:TetR/AcrR family transcriptional regulator C-terminal domain-containing protein [Labedaea rhizosphaerae]TDP91128.1 TetR family transcriptional regulator [Labedaea rhizosphaerae]